MKKNSLTIFVFLLPVLLFSQSRLKLIVQDSLSGSPLIGATIMIAGTGDGTVADENGMAELDNLPNGPVRLECSYVGYAKKTVAVQLPSNVPLKILLAPIVEEVGQVIVASTRTNSRIEDLPIKVEVLGTAELDEEATLVPGGMGSLLGDLAVITIQRINPVNGNDAVRMQGLDAGYTQLLQDGMPLYEGFSGSLDVLAIPPLDLRQVEIIKGSASTLYGAGAIGGLVNFLTRTPGQAPATTFVLNQTSLGETDLNAFASRRFGTNGFTLLASGTRRPAKDINSDGFAEVPLTNRWLVHPRFFWNLDKKTSGNLGLTVSENRFEGGDFQAIQDGAASAGHLFFQKEKTQRLTLAGQVESKLNAHLSLTLRGTGSFFKRGGDYVGFDFEGKQASTYTEANALYQQGAHNLVLGGNFIGEDFRQTGRERAPFGNYRYSTLGAFVQDDWQLAKRFAVEAGLRFNHHNRFGDFLLPRIGLFFKPNKTISVRLAYGTGYKTPDLFSAVAPTEYRLTRPILGNTKADRSQGLNMDANWHRLIGNELGLELNQAFYFTKLENPYTLGLDNDSLYFLLQNAPWRTRSLGSDTYLSLHWRGWELYLGYNHTLAQYLPKNGGEKQPTPFNPQDKIAATLAYGIGEHWRMGLEAARTGNQYVANAQKVPDFWFVAAMAAYDFKWGSLVLNCENLTDSRQSRHEPLVTGTAANPLFTPVWGPVEGRVVNLALKISW